jgi:hypothetical protein
MDTIGLKTLNNNSGVQFMQVLPAISFSATCIAGPHHRNNLLDPIHLQSVRSSIGLEFRVAGILYPVGFVH